MELREQVARLLAERILARTGDRHPFDELFILNKRKFLEAADEVIRQIEWAAYIAFHRGEQREYEWDECHPTRLAPEDWNG